ncbi:unnamed protein product [Amoebophrya sp. A120]|nr:unnamed protein product [Amoebophrya sp. A120]|eukprot:GSA120T00001209001.1
MQISKDPQHKFGTELFLQIVDENATQRNRLVAEGRKNRMSVFRMKLIAQKRSCNATMSLSIEFKVRLQIFSSLKLSRNRLPGLCRALKEFTVGAVRLPLEPVC